MCQRLWKNSINHKAKTIFLPCSDLEGTRRTLKVKKIQLLFIWQASNHFMGKVFLSLTYFLTSKCSQCTRSKVSHVQLTPTMLGVVASIWTQLKVWPVSNFAQLLPTTYNGVCKRTQHVTSNNVAPNCTGLNLNLRPLSW